MTNPFILKMWVKSKIKDLERDSQVCITEADAYKIQGKLDILMEFYDDFNLESIDEKEIVIHNKF
jgi:hypothetical protein